MRLSVGTSFNLCALQPNGILVELAFASTERKVCNAKPIREQFGSNFQKSLMSGIRSKYERDEMNAADALALPEIILG